MSSTDFFTYDIGDLITIKGITHKFLDFIDRMGRAKLCPITYYDRNNNKYNSVEDYLDDNKGGQEEDLMEVPGTPFWIDFRDIEDD